MNNVIDLPVKMKHRISVTPKEIWAAPDPSDVLTWNIRTPISTLNKEE